MESSVDEQRFASSVPDADGSMDLPEMWLDLAGGSAGQRWDAATPSLGMYFPSKSSICIQVDDVVTYQKRSSISNH